jgi:predicted lactoylglutathione lyase
MTISTTTAITRVTVITLGVGDLAQATAFYSALFTTRPNPDYQGVSFFELPGAWLSLYPLDKLAEDIGPDLPVSRSTFNGVTLAYNARSREEVDAVVAQAARLGARIAKAPQDTFWGGYSGYFADPDGFYWEVAWGPMFDFAEDGSLRLKK